MSGLRINLMIAEDQSETTGGSKCPERPSTMLSRGPPEFIAMTGLQWAIASSGAIPQSSLSGVNRQKDVLRNKSKITSSEGDKMNSILSLPFATSRKVLR